jgi:hypothetical protein
MHFELSEAAGQHQNRASQNERVNLISNRYRLLIPLIINAGPDAPTRKRCPAMGGSCWVWGGVCSRMKCPSYNNFHRTYQGTYQV